MRTEAMAEAEKKIGNKTTNMYEDIEASPESKHKRKEGTADAKAEHEAREKLHYARPGDVIVALPDQPKPQPPAPTEGK